MKVKLLKKLRAEAKDAFYVLREVDKVNHVYVYNVMHLYFTRTVFKRVDNLEEAKRTCDRLRREYIWREI